MLRQKRFWLGLLISLVLVVVFFYETDVSGMVSALAQAQYIYLIPALALYFLGVGARAIRWHFLLRSIKPIASARLFPVVVIGYMANDLLPARIGELVRAFVLGQQEGISKTSTLVTIALERILDGLTMLAFIGAASFFLPLTPALEALFQIGIVLFVVVLVLLVLVATQRQRFDPLVHAVLKRLPERYGARAVRLFDSFIHGLSALRNPLDAVIAFGWSVVAWALETGMYWIIGLAFGIVQPYSVYALATAVANLVTIVPSTPGYVGVFDVPVKSILTLFGVAPNVATSYTLVLHAALVLPVVVLGLYYAARAGLSLGTLSQRVESAPS